MTYRDYTIQNSYKNYVKIVGSVMSWSVIVPKLCINTSNIGTKIIKIGKNDLCVCVCVCVWKLLSHKCWSRDINTH